MATNRGRPRAPEDGGAENRPSPWEPCLGREHVLLTPWSQTSGLQNFQSQSHCSEPPVCGHLLQEPQDTQMPGRGVSPFLCSSKFPHSPSTLPVSSVEKHTDRPGCTQDKTKCTAEAGAWLGSARDHLPGPYLQTCPQENRCPVSHRGPLHRGCAAGSSWWPGPSWWLPRETDKLL